MYCIYKHTCPNGKVYIGMTCLSITDRWRNNGKGYKTQFFYKAIQKYGWENINHEILFDNLTKEQAEELEVEQIGQYKSNDAKYGYNIDNGGKGGERMGESTKEKLRVANIGKHHTEEAKKKMSLSRTGKKLSFEHKEQIGKGNKGKRLSQETKDKIKEKHIGKRLSDDTKSKISVATAGENNPNAKIILLVDESGNILKEYATSQQAQRELDVCKNSITAVLKGRKSQVKGYIFRYKQHKAATK